MSDYKQKPDSGALRATQSKRTPMSPDYWGNIVINLADETGFVREGNNLTVKISGWKRADASGKTYLSLSVDRWVPTGQTASKPAPAKGKSGFDDMDSDVPF